MSNIIKDKKASYSTDLVWSIVINSSHFKAGSKGAFVYNLPSSWTSDGNAGVGLASLTMYNSTFNITCYNIIVICMHHDNYTVIY